MNKKGKSWPLFVVAILIVVFSLTAIFGVSYQYGDTKNIYIKGASDIRFGIDIRGGVDVTFMPAGDVDATPEQMTAAKTVIEDRLVGLGITDYESYVDSNKDRIMSVSHGRPARLISTRRRLSMRSAPPLRWCSARVPPQMGKKSSAVTT